MFGEESKQVVSEGTAGEATPSRGTASVALETWTTGKNLVRALFLSRQALPV